jgi:HEAT repeat protein
MAPSSDRTSKMEAVFQRMRGVAIASYPLLEELSNSPSPGDRLAAVSILQTIADEGSLNFLVELVGSEKPFVGYHATKALRYAVSALDTQSYPKLRDALLRAEGLLDRAAVGFDTDRRSELAAARRELEDVVLTTASARGDFD